MNKNVLLVVDSLSNEKNIDKDIIFEAVELALAVATKKKSGLDIDVKVVIDKKTGDYETFRVWTIVTPEELREPLAPGEVAEEGDERIEYNTHKHILEGDEQAEDKKSGEYILEPMESIEFGRIAAQTAKQVIVQKVREAERSRILKSYQDHIGEIITATVKKAIRDVVILDLGSNAESYIKREDMIPKEVVRPGERMRALLVDMQEDVKGLQLVLSRTHPQMLVELFKIEVPEISEGVIEIKSAARDPGSRAKIAVKTNDGRIDPVGACVGMRGTRVQAVSNELGGERVDIVLWDENPAQFVINAMAPAEVASIEVDEEKMAMDVAVSEDQLSQAIGRNGQNVKLACKLTGWNINVLTEADMEAKTKGEQGKLVDIFMSQLEVDEEVAQVLVEIGFSSIEEIAYISLEDILETGAFDEETATELRVRAKDALLTKAIASEQRLEEAKPSEELLQMEGMDRELAVQLAAKGIVTMDDLAEQAVEDLTDIEGMTAQRASKLIMKAREPWFADSEGK